MNSFEEFFSEIAKQQWSLESQALTQLLCLGSFNHFKSWVLFRDYKEWGILHLLILSGSQFYSFAFAWEKIILFFQKIIFKTSSLYWTKLSTLLASLYYLHLLNYPPPMVRCALLWGLFLFFSQKEKALVWAFAFSLQIFIIEHSEPGTSAFLSWCAFLTLLSSQILFKGNWARSLSTTMVLQFILWMIKDTSMSIPLLVKASFTNLLALPIYEKVVFPVLGFISAFSLFVYAGTNRQLYDIIGLFASRLFSLILDIALSPVLVVNGVFRYTL